MMFGPWFFVGLVAVAAITFVLPSGWQWVGVVVAVPIGILFAELDERRDRRLANTTQTRGEAE